MCISCCIPRCIPRCIPCCAQCSSCCCCLAIFVLLLWFAVVSLCSLLFHVCFTVSGGKCEYVYTCKLQRFIIKFSATWVHVCFLWFKIIFTFFPSFSLSSIIKCYLLICLVKCPQERKQNPLPFYGCQMKCCLTSSVGVGSVWASVWTLVWARQLLS